MCWQARWFRCIVCSFGVEQHLLRFGLRLETSTFQAMDAGR